VPQIQDQGDRRSAAGPHAYRMAQSHTAILGFHIGTAIRSLRAAQILAAEGGLEALKADLSTAINLLVDARPRAGIDA
jgi:hypothetical protein